MPMESNRIKIHETPGVYPVREDTRLLAGLALSYMPEKILDLGTGSGYIAIYLAKQGIEADAVDISPKALESARENARANAVNLRVFYSNLYENVDKVYDIIIYNPSLTSPGISISNRLKKIVWKYFNFPFLRNLSIKLFQQCRLKSLSQMIEQSPQYLTEDGFILLHVFKDDLRKITDARIAVEILREVYPWTVIARVARKSTHE